ncbi:MAG: radical SAM protein [Anaerolineae bacterium]|nr:radical SAM protein [Anaerolineae bacterium]
MTGFEPAYRALLASGELARRAAAAQAHMKACVLCAWKCRANRTSSKLGACRTGLQARVSSYFSHLGEENCLRGWRGSGTIFFASCNLRCQFCQNYEISMLDQGVIVTAEELAGFMLELQAEGAHNINLVSPSHVVAQILEAVLIAAENGLRLPLVYNTGGYDSPEALRLLDGVIDIYMPDMKYGDAAAGQKYSKVPDYPRHNCRAVREMHRQVGDLVIDPETGLALRGLLVRHLVLPGGLAGTRQVMRFLAREISPDTFVNIMGQYLPAYNAAEMEGPLGRPVLPEEVADALRIAREAGLHRFDERRPLFG